MVDKNCGRYLYRKRGVFYFSRHVPIDMRAHHGRSRIVVCLKTKSGNAAVKGSQALAQKLDDYWLSLRIQQAPILSVQACVANPQKASIDVPCVSDALAAYLALKGFNKGECLHVRPQGMWNTCMLCAIFVPSCHNSKSFKRIKHNNNHYKRSE